MSYFSNVIYSFPPLVLRVLLTIFFSFFLLFGTKLVLCFAPPHSEDSDAIIGLSATVTFIYTIFFGFVIFFSINNFNDAKDSERKEALDVQSVNYEARLLGDSFYSQTRSVLINYLDTAIHEEWPAAHDGRINHSASLYLSRLDQLTAGFKPNDSAQVGVWLSLIQALHSLHADYDARIDDSSGSSIGRNIWICLVASTFVMLISNMFYVFNQRREQYILLLCIGSVAASLIFLEISVDSPYRGSYAVVPSHLQAALQSLRNGDEVSTAILPAQN